MSEAVVDIHNHVIAKNVVRIDNHYVLLSPHPFRKATVKTLKKVLSDLEESQMMLFVLLPVADIQEENDGTV